MKRRISLILIALLVITALAIPASAQAPCIIDDAGLLTDEELQQLTAQAEQIADAYDCGIYILTVPDYTDYANGRSVIDTTRYLYESLNYGVGDDTSGIVLMLSIADRDYGTWRTGFADEAISEKAMISLEKNFLDDFKDDQWYDGFEDYLTVGGKMLEAARNGKPMKEYVPNARAYGILACTLLGFLVAFLVKGVLKGQMTSVAEKTEAAGFIGGDGLELTRKEDYFTHRTQTRVYDPPQKSSSDRSSSSSSSGSGSSGKF